MLKARGFTMTELLVAIGIVAIGAAIAAPAASGMIAGRKVQGAAQSIIDGLNNARSEAVRRNTPVQFALRSDGWSVVQSSSGDTLQSFVDGDWRNLQVTSTTSATVTFLATGMRQTAGTQLSEVTVSSPVGTSPTRRINVFGGGLIRMCDPAITVASDPRRC